MRAVLDFDTRLSVKKRNRGGEEDADDEHSGCGGLREGLGLASRR